MHETQPQLYKSPSTFIKIVRIGPYYASSGQDFLPHQHPFWEIIYYREGQIYSKIDSKIYHTFPGMVLLIPPGTIHSEQAVTDYGNYWVQFTTNESDLFWPPCCTDDAYHTLGNIFRSLVDEFLGDAPDRNIMLELLMKQLDILLQRKQVTSKLPGAEGIVQAAERLLRERFTSSVTIQQIAQELGVSSSSLRAYFVQLRGESPKSYLKRLRLECALVSLQNPSVSLESVAQICGYYSSSHLSRHVKKETGKNPGAFRVDK